METEMETEEKMEYPQTSVNKLGRLASRGLLSFFHSPEHIIT